MGRGALHPRLVAAVREDGRALFQIGAQAGIHPSTLSQWLTGAGLPRVDDPRVRELAIAVGLPEDVRPLVVPLAPVGGEGTR